MRCQKCGAELENGVIFCRDCGAKVGSPIRFCRDCGVQLPEGSKFCSQCGSTQDITDSANSNVTKKKTGGKSRPPIVLIAVAAGIVLITIVIGVYYLFGAEKKKTTSTNLAFDEITPNVTGSDTIEPGTEYAYMTGGWDVYIATAITDTVIQIEAWDKTLQSSKSMKFQSDLGTYDIQDEKNGFSWVDEEHTTFTLFIQDRNNYTRLGKPTLVLFTINLNDSNENKGTNYDESIICYEYEKDDWHLYRAIPLTDTLIKIECWYRVSSGFWSPFLYSWDVGVIDIENTDTDIKWGGNKGFALTMRDPESEASWRKEELVSFKVSNKNYKYASVVDYLGRTTNSSVSHNDYVVNNSYQLDFVSILSMKTVSSGENYTIYNEFFNDYIVEARWWDYDGTMGEPGIYDKNATILGFSVQVTDGINDTIYYAYYYFEDNDISDYDITTPIISREIEPEEYGDGSVYYNFDYSNRIKKGYYLLVIAKDSSLNEPYALACAEVK